MVDTEPPAETQQDEEQFDTPRADAITAVHRLLASQSRAHEARHDNAVQIVDAVVAALAARPSADTETLRQVRDGIDALLRNRPAVSEADVWWSLGQLRAALDGDR